MMVKKIILCLIFFFVSPLALAFPFYLLGYRPSGEVLGESISVSPNPGKIYAALSAETGVIAPVIVSSDSTSVIIEKYLRRYQSPLLPYSDKIISAAEKYGIKPQLVVAIAQQESNLGKKSPEGCFNAWGWGIHAKGTKCYANWEEAIEGVTKGMAKDYCIKGFCEDPCEMMKKYTPRSNGSWCAGIKQFLSELESGNF